MPGHVLPENRTRLAALVEDITALAETIRVHGAVPDCGTRVDAVVAKHRAMIEAARRLEGDSPSDPAVAAL